MDQAWRLWRPDARATVHHGRTVHAVERDGDGAPVPVCRVGVSGWHPTGVLTVTRAPVDCRRCLRSLPDSTHHAHTAGQLTLW